MQPGLLISISLQNAEGYVQKSSRGFLPCTVRTCIKPTWWYSLLQVRIPNSKPRVFSSNDLTRLGPSAWSETGSGARAGAPETVMVRQYGFPSCQGSAPSSAPASTGFVPPAANCQVGLLKAVAAKPPMSNSPLSGETLACHATASDSCRRGLQCDAVCRAGVEQRRQRSSMQDNLGNLQHQAWNDHQT